MLKTKIFKCYKGKTKDALLREETDLRLRLLETPGDLTLMKKLGALLYYKQDIHGAIKVYEKVGSREPENSHVHGFLGYLFYECDNLENAAHFMEKAVELDPKSPFIHFLLGNVYSRMGKIREAVRNYDFALFLDFDIYLAHKDFAKKYEDMGRIGKALKEYKAAYEIDPRDEKIKKKIETLQGRISLNQEV